MATEFIASTIPAKTIRVSGTTLFHVAAHQFGDPLQWWPIARLNGLIDPWVFAQANIEIPPTLPSVPPTGLPW